MGSSITIDYKWLQKDLFDPLVGPLQVSVDIRVMAIKSTQHSWEL